jgi:DNA-binding FrmR family transcriptional regulator
MVEGESYCIDIIHQSLAVQAALRQTDQIILENHMRTCVAAAIKNGKSNEVISEVMKVIDRSQR